MSGTWRGTLVDPQAGAAEVTLTLTQTSISATLVNVTGTWRVAVATGSRTSSGVVTGGREEGERWLLYLDPLGQPPCAGFPFPYNTHGQGYQLNLTRSGNRLAGTSTYRTCTEAVQGTIDVTR